MSAADALGLPPGVRFDPTPEELVEFYLMPRALGQPTAVQGIIIDDAEAATSSRHPWRLLTGNRRTDDDEAYFFERIAIGGGDDARGGGGAARQDRSCGGGLWTWVGQKRAPNEVMPVRGEQVSWGKYSLNLHEGRRKGGSTGWVMHEYTIASPQCGPCPVKLCHVAFTGHGQKRKRVPDDYDGEGEDQELEDGTPQHKRVATESTTPAPSVITTATPGPGPPGGLGAARAKNQEQPFQNYETPSSVGNFWGSCFGFSQESSIRFSQESSITVVDPWYPDAGTSHQEPFLLDQKLAQNQAYFSNQPQAYHQEQFVNQGAPSAEAFCAMLLAASGLGSSNPGQEPPSGEPLSKEEQFRLQLDQFFGGISMPQCAPVEPVTVSADAAYHEEQHIQFQTTAPAATADLPLPMDQESCATEESHGDTDDLREFFWGWSDLDTFTDTSGVQDYGDGMCRNSCLLGRGQTETL